MSFLGKTILKSCLLGLKVKPKSTMQNVADDILFFYFSEKIRHNILCELFAKQIHMKCQALFMLKKKEKEKKKNSKCCQQL